MAQKPLQMVSMEMDDEQKLDALMPITMPERPDYPCGLRLCLTEAEFEKLGLDHADVAKGGLMHIHAMARVTDVTRTDRNGDKTCRVELQIEELAVESEDAEN